MINDKSQFFNTDSITFCKTFSVHRRVEEVKNLVADERTNLTVFFSDDYDVLSFETGDLQLPGNRYQWQVKGNEFLQVGSLTFLDRGEDTELKLQLSLEFSEKFNHAVTRGYLKFGGKEWFDESCRKLKQLMETGVTATVEGQSHGERGILGGNISSARDYFLEKIDDAMGSSVTIHEQNEVRA